MSKESVSKQGPLRRNERWSVRRKRDVVLRLLRGEPLDTLSRELGVESYRLEQWQRRQSWGSTSRYATGRAPRCPKIVVRLRNALRELFLRIPTHPRRDITQLLAGHWKREILPTVDTFPRP